MKLSERFWLAVGIVTVIIVQHFGIQGMKMCCPFEVTTLRTVLLAIAMIVTVAMWLFIALALGSFIVHQLKKFSAWLDKMDQPKEPK